MDASSRSVAGSKMQYARLGNSGLRVSKLVLGTMSFGKKEWQEWVHNEDVALPILEYAYKCGINTWDTADIYSHGESERIIGKALKKFQIPRENVVILTKSYFGLSEDGSQLPLEQCMFNEGKMVNRVGLGRKKIFEAVDACVQRLGTYIDVFQIHRLDRDVPMKEIMRALNDVVNSGKVRYIGASSMAAWEFQKLQSIAEANNWHQFISMQNYYNLLYREEEREMLPYCADAGVGIIPWSPVARGVLTRPWGASTKRDETDQNKLPPGEEQVDKAIVDRVAEIARNRGVSMATVSTAWVLHKGAYPVLGLNSQQRIDDALTALEFKLTKDEISYLEEPYQPRRIVGY